MSYKRLGDYIERCDEKNDGNHIKLLQGISNQKYFQKAKTNTIGVDLSKYRIVRKGQFAFNRATTRNGDKISIALRKGEDCIVSPSYRIFKSKDENVLNSDYLLMWFKRPIFDRYARFKSHGSAHEFFDWDEMCEVELPIPPIEEQRAIVAEYQTVTDRIQLNEQINAKLEETAQALYRHWFIDFEFPDDNGKPYKSSGGKMVWNEELGKEVPEGWEVKALKNISSKIGSGSTPRGGKESYKKEGIALIRSMNVHDWSFKIDDLAFIDEAQALKLKNVEVKADDILFNITGASVARTCIVPSSILPARVNQHVMIIRTHNKYISYYVSILLYQKDAKKELIGVSESGSTREAITKDEMENFNILVPKENLLIEFFNVINEFNKKKQKHFQEINELENLKSLLLSKMATNKSLQKATAI
jgi:type I restriction enzyme S subunit